MPISVLIFLLIIILILTICSIIITSIEVQISDNFKAGGVKINKKIYGGIKEELDIILRDISQMSDLEPDAIIAKIEEKFNNIKRQYDAEQAQTAQKIAEISKLKTETEKILSDAMEFINSSEHSHKDEMAKLFVENQICDEVKKKFENLVQKMIKLLDNDMVIPDLSTINSKFDNYTTTANISNEENFNQNFDTWYRHKKAVFEIIRDKFTEINKENEQLQQRHLIISYENSVLENQINNQNALLDTYESKALLDTIKFKKLKTDYTEEKLRLDEDYRQFIKKIEEEYADNIHNHLDRLNQLKDDHEEEIKKLEKYYADIIDNLNNNHAKEIQQLKDDHKERIKFLEDRHTNDIVKLEAEMVTRERDYEDNLEELRQEYDANFDKQQRDFDEKNEKFKDTMEQKLLENKDTIDAAVQDFEKNHTSLSKLLDKFKETYDKLFDQIKNTLRARYNKLTNKIKQLDLAQITYTQQFEEYLVKNEGKIKNLTALVRQISRMV